MQKEHFFKEHKYKPARTEHTLTSYLRVLKYSPETFL